MRPLRALTPFLSAAELKATFQLPIIGVKKNPQSPMYTQLGVITKGTVIEVNVSELGLVTAGGKVVWGKYAQVTNNPVRLSLTLPLPLELLLTPSIHSKDLDGTVNGVLLVRSAFVFFFFERPALTLFRAGLIHLLAADRPIGPRDHVPRQSLRHTVPRYRIEASLCPGAVATIPFRLLSRPRLVFLCTLRLQCCHQQSLVGDTRISATTEACRACRLKLCTA